MKFMVNWSIDQENWLPILEKWTSMTPDEQMNAGDGVKIVGRWHDMTNRSGVAIVEAADATALMTYMGQWNPHMDMDATPVADDAEATATGKAILAGVG